MKRFATRCASRTPVLNYFQVDRKGARNTPPARHRSSIRSTDKSTWFPEMTGPTLLFLFLVTTSLSFAQQEERSFIAQSPDVAVDRTTSAAILEAACGDGKIDGGSCSKCPDSGEGIWSIGSIVTGHFSSPDSEEAFIGSSNCSYVGRESGFGMLLGKRNGKWVKLNEGIPAVHDGCMRRKQHSGREFLICESWNSHRDGEHSYLLGTVSVENESFAFHVLFTASDTSRCCYTQGKVQKAEVQDIRFRDLNGDGLEDISITATYGAFEMSEARQAQCAAANAERDRLAPGVQPVKKYPQPPVIKTYRIQYLFDGNVYTPTPESQAAVDLFHTDG